MLYWVRDHGDHLLNNGFSIIISRKSDQQAAIYLLPSFFDIVFLLLHNGWFIVQTLRLKFIAYLDFNQAGSKLVQLLVFTDDTIIHINKLSIIGSSVTLLSPVFNFQKAVRWCSACTIITAAKKRRLLRRYLLLLELWQIACERAIIAMCTTAKQF